MHESEITNVAYYLDLQAKSVPKQLAVVIPHEGKDYSYQQLLEESNRIASGLIKLGLKKGMRTALFVKPSLDFFALAFALFRAGIVLVLIDPAIGLKHLKTCLSVAKPDAFIGIPTAHLARKLFGWGNETIQYNITAGFRLGWGGYSLAQIKKKGCPDFKCVETSLSDIAAICFTSGSTGLPKGVVYQHKQFLAQIKALKETYHIQPGEIDLPTFPLFALFDPALGMTTIVPDMDSTKPAQVNPKKIIKAIQEYKVTNMFGSPALIRRVVTYALKNNIRFPNLKRVVSAGAPVPFDVLKDFKKLLSKEAEIYTPYGATEVLPVSSISANEILTETAERTAQGAGICVGKPVEGNEIKIIKITEDAIENISKANVLAANKIGEIIVKGPSVTGTYFNQPDKTSLAKIKADNAVWHRMGDVGYLDDEGRLWFCGRKAHRVELGNKSLYSIPVESIINVNSNIFRSALIAVKKNNKVHAGLCIELKNNLKKYKKEMVAQEILKMIKENDKLSSIKYIYFHKHFPVDIRHNAKINREQLAAWAETEKAFY